MIEVEVPELGIVEFPDDTTPKVMEDTLSRHFKREELGKQMEQTRKERKLTDFAQRAAQIGEAAIEPLTPSGMMNQPFRLVNVPDAYQAGRPLISLPKPTGTGVLSGLGQLAAQTVEGFTTPEMIITGAAFPASPVARALVAGEMATTLPESIAAGAEAMRSPEATPAQKVVSAGTPLVTAAFVRGIGKTPEWLGPSTTRKAQPTRFQPPPDSINAASESPSNLTVSDASIKQGSNLLQGNVVDRPMVSRVLATLHDDKIFKSVVQSVPVDVMNALVGKDVSAESLLNNKSMLLDKLSAFSSQPSVPASVVKFIDTVLASPEVDAAVLGAKGELSPGLTAPSLEAASTKLADIVHNELLLGPQQKQHTPLTSEVPNAISIRGPTALSLEVPPGDRQAVGTRVPEPEKAPAAQAQEVPPVVEGTGGKAQGEVLLNPEAKPSLLPQETAPVEPTTGVKALGKEDALNSIYNQSGTYDKTERKWVYPPRENVVSSIEKAKQAGVRIEYQPPSQAGYAETWRIFDDVGNQAIFQRSPDGRTTWHGFTQTPVLVDKPSGTKVVSGETIPQEGTEVAGSTLGQPAGSTSEKPLVLAAKPSLLAQEKAPQPAAPEAALGESSKGVVEPISATPPPAITTDKLIQSKEQVAQPEVVGMGGATAGEKPAAAQIEQLTEAFKGVESEKAPLIDRVKESFRIGENTAATKDALSKAVNGLKTAGDYIITKWRGIPDVDEFRRAEGELSGQLETRGWRVREWVKQARKAVPSKRTQAAIAKWVDSGGNRSALELGLAETKPEYKQAYLDALNLQGDVLVAAENIRNYFDSRLQEAIDAGVLKEGVEDYVHRIYESRPDVAQKAIARLQSGLLKPNPSLIKKRVFDYDWEAEKLGYRPVQSFIQRISAYEAALSKAIASREFIKKATTMKAADGRPVVDVKGVGIPIEEEGVREGTLIKPQFNPAKANDPGTENYRGDYVNKEFPSLSKWKWVSNDAAGKPIFVQGDVAIHPDYAPRITALLEPSRVRYGKYGKVIRPVLKASSTIKQTMLSLSGFHNVQILVHGMEHKVMPWKLVQKIDFADPNVDALLKGGVTLGGDFYGGYAPEGLFGTALTHKIPWLGPLAESYQTWLFQSFIPRMKLTMALNALERNRARFAGEMTDEQIAFKTAYEANSAFGELNYILLERSKTTQDLARLLLLAPDFLEARGRFALEGLEKGGKSKVPGFGNEQRAALLLGAMTMYITARIANKILDDQYHFEPENMFSVVYKNHAYSLRTVQGDILHLIEHPLQFWMNRLNPGITRPLLQIATGRDYFGRKRTPLETLADTAVNMVPISLRHGRERTIWESFANSFGVNARRYNATDDAFKLAQKWKADQGIQERGEFIYDSEKDPLRPLKIALSSSDDVAAAAELKKLFDSGVKRQKLNDYFNRYARMPFTGSKSNDRKWMETLNADDRKTVESAIEHKKAIRQLYWNALGIYDSKPEKP